jgi:hypothetical protein
MKTPRNLDQPFSAAHPPDWDIIGASGILAYFVIEAARLLTKAR